MDNIFNLSGLQRNEKKSPKNESSNIDFEALTSIETKATARLNQNQEHRSKNKADSLHDLDWLGSTPEPTKIPQTQRAENGKSSSWRSPQFSLEDRMNTTRNEYDKDRVSTEFSDERLSTTTDLVMNSSIKSMFLSKDAPPENIHYNTSATITKNSKPAHVFSIASSEDCSKFFEDPKFCSLLQAMLLDRFSVETNITGGLHQNPMAPSGYSILLSGSTIKITEACDKLDVFLKLSSRKVTILKEQNWWAASASSTNILQALIKEENLTCTLQSLCDVGIMISYFMSSDPILAPFCTTETAIRDLINHNTSSQKIELPNGIDKIDIDRAFAEFENIATTAKFKGQISLLKDQTDCLVFGLKKTVEIFLGETTHIIVKYSPKVIPLTIQPYQIQYLLEIRRDALLNFEKQYAGITVIETLPKGHILGYPRLHNGIKENIQEMINSCVQQKFQINNKDFGITVIDGSYFEEQSKCFQCLANVDIETFKIPMECPKSLINQAESMVCPSSMSIDIREGDLANQAVDMIVVCSTSEYLLKDILEKAGDQIKKDFNNAKKNNKINASGYELPGGELLCQNLFFLPWTTEKLPGAKLRSSIRKFLDTAIKHAVRYGKTSIAFPAIGCGELKYDAKVIADIILKECQRFANYKLQIIIVLLPNKQDDYEAFCSKLASLRVKELVGAAPKTYQHTCKVLSILATGYTEHIQIYRTKMQEYVQKSIITTDCDQIPLHVWNQSVIDKFYRYCTEQQVFINIVKPKDHLTLTGFPEHVREAQTEFYRLTTIATEEARIVAFARIAVWALEVSPGRIENYSPKINATIEYAYMNSEKSVSFKNETDELCQIDFQRMIENCENRERTIMRKDFQLPKTWVPQSSNVHRTLLDPDDPYYSQVKAQFDKTMSGKYSTIKIERIQNRRWYTSYNAFKQHFTDPSTREFLFHGCPETSAEMIIHTCFNRSLAGVNGTVYGAGVYFSRKAVYSHDFTRPAPNTNNRCMFLVRVLIGKAAKGNKNMRKPPDGYDSTTDGDHIFVTYHDDQMYAHYLITYLSN